MPFSSHIAPLFFLCCCVWLAFVARRCESESILILIDLWVTLTLSWLFHLYCFGVVRIILSLFHLSLMPENHAFYFYWFHPPLAHKCHLKWVFVQSSSTYFPFAIYLFSVLTLPLSLFSFPLFVVASKKWSCVASKMWSCVTSKRWSCVAWNSSKAFGAIGQLSTKNVEISSDYAGSVEYSLDWRVRKAKPAYGKLQK